MPTDYEALYRQTKRALGEPAGPVVGFFRTLDLNNASVLDVGCGQGRDALFVAGLGHAVTAVDWSPTGIADLLEDARDAGLDVTGVVADIRAFRTDSRFDVVLFDRVLHMLAEHERLDVLRRLAGRVRPEGFVLILDEPRNIAVLRGVLEEEPAGWHFARQPKGQLLAERVAAQAP